jgi:hypothetical protein
LIPGLLGGDFGVALVLEREREKIERRERGKKKYSCVPIKTTNMP